VPLVGNPVVDAAKMVPGFVLRLTVLLPDAIQKCSVAGDITVDHNGGGD